MLRWWSLEIAKFTRKIAWFGRHFWSPPAWFLHPTRGWSSRIFGRNEIKELKARAGLFLCLKLMVYQIYQNFHQSWLIISNHGKSHIRYLKDISIRFLAMSIAVLAVPRSGHKNVPSLVRGLEICSQVPKWIQTSFFKRRNAVSRNRKYPFLSSFYIQIASIMITSYETSTYFMASVNFVNQQYWLIRTINNGY